VFRAVPIGSFPAATYRTPRRSDAATGSGTSQPILRLNPRTTFDTPDARTLRAIESDLQSVDGGTRAEA
jgi:hypothetical protein